eukprot:14880877-Heterocapsa_arctica.AAC.1
MSAREVWLIFADQPFPGSHAVGGGDQADDRQRSAMAHLYQEVVQEPGSSRVVIGQEVHVGLVPVVHRFLHDGVAPEQRCDAFHPKAELRPLSVSAGEVRWLCDSSQVHQPRRDLLE